MTTQEILLHLNLIENIGPAAILRILKNFENRDLKSLYDYNENDCKEIFKISDVVAGVLFNGLKDKKKLDQELQLIEKNSISITTVLDEDYPILLRHIDHPPMVLYFKGSSLDSFQKNIAIVGARKANYYGQKVVNLIVPDLIKHNFVIVSGGALGVDTMAHTCALASKGKTIAVLGSGLLKPYPMSNRKLFENMVHDGGAVVSSFPLTTEPAPWNFPARNRIISGLSSGCIVVQAGLKSGALITAKFALDQAREVFAVPGQIDDELSVGCHSLLSQGATLVSNAQDILFSFGILPPKNEPKKNVQQEDVQLPIGIDSEIDSLEYKILKFSREPISIDEMSEAVKVSFSELQNILFQLQIDGKIEQNFAGLWQTL